MPTFSVVIPTFDRPVMLEAAVRSVVAQSFTDYEILVADDGSEPPAAESLRTCPSDKLRVIRIDGRQGAGAARNRAIEVASGRYISLLDDDDCYLKDFLLRTHQILSNAPPAVGFSWSGVRFVNHLAGASLGPSMIDKQFPEIYPSQQAMYADLLDIGAGFGITFKAECFEAIGLFDESLRCVEDADLFLRLLAAGIQPAVVPEILVEIHNHSGVRLTGSSMVQCRVAENEWLIERYAPFFAQYPGLKTHLQEYVVRLRFLLASEDARIHQG
jgi:glycosyltransferase involved in cell wall biosynthesis